MRVNYRKLPLWRLKEERDAIERAESSRNKIGEYLFNAEAIRKLDTINQLIRALPRKRKGKP